jgi:hypothetical protein
MNFVFVAVRRCRFRNRRSWRVHLARQEGQEQLRIGDDGIARAAERDR